jgi:hypothetical protein
MSWGVAGHQTSDLTIVLDRESDPQMSYTLHSECLSALRELLPNPMRLVEMGPASWGAECGAVNCARKVN